MAYEWFVHVLPADCADDVHVVDCVDIECAASLFADTHIPASPTDSS